MLKFTFLIVAANKTVLYNFIEKITLSTSFITTKKDEKLNLLFIIHYYVINVYYNEQFSVFKISRNSTKLKY